MKQKFEKDVSKIYPTMTVGQLISELNRIPNKNRPVFICSKETDSEIKCVSLKENTLDGYILIKSEGKR